jgi:hypothetical protein
MKLERSEMKPILFPRVSRLALFALLAMSVASGAAMAQDKGKSQDKPQQASEAELKAIQKIQTAPDAATKAKAAAEYAKKFPKGVERAKVVGFLIDEINKADEAQRITLLEGMVEMFKEPADADIINPALIDAYIKANRHNDAFRVANALISRKPNDLSALTQMALVGVEQAKQGNGAYLPQSQEMAKKAIEVIESGNRPAGFSDDRWQEFQTVWLPRLYQWMGLMAMMSQNKGEAMTRLEKSASLNPKDPFTFVLIGSIYNEEYRQAAEKHRTQGQGPLRDSLLKEAYAKMDQVIEYYARAVALAVGRPDYQKLHDDILQDLKQYYSFRHGGKTDGLQQLIDKYKVQQ